MYCIECGVQIPDNSKFCSHCGHKQIEVESPLNEVIIEKKIIGQVIETHESSIDYQFLKKTMGWYLAWVLLNLGLLLIAARTFLPDGFSNSDFYPFSDRSKANDYDIREFLVYTIFPLVILVIWSMVQTHEQESIITDKNDENAV